jgi:hypothetical protein
VQLGGEVAADPPTPLFARRVRRRVPISVGVTAVVLFAAMLITGTEPTGRDAIGVAIWATVIGLTIGLGASLPTPRGRWWRWTAPALATAASVPLVGATGIVLWFAAGGELGFFGDPDQPADAWWYGPASVGLVGTWLASIAVGFGLAERRRRYALTPLAVAAGVLALLGVVVNVT